VKKGREDGIIEIEEVSAKTLYVTGGRE